MCLLPPVRPNTSAMRGMLASALAYGLNQVASSGASRLLLLLSCMLLLLLEMLLLLLLMCGAK